MPSLYFKALLFNSTIKWTYLTFSDVTKMAAILNGKKYWNGDRPVSTPGTSAVFVQSFIEIVLLDWTTDRQTDSYYLVRVTFVRYLTQQILLIITCSFPIVLARTSLSMHVSRLISCFYRIIASVVMLETGAAGDDLDLLAVCVCVCVVGGGACIDC